MEQNKTRRPAPAAPGRPRLTREQWLARRRRRRLRLLRNWLLFLSACGAAVGLMTGLILWALPQVSALLGGRQEAPFDYAIPGAGVTHRAILIRKAAPTLKGYPRRWAKIQKEPL